MLRRSQKNELLKIAAVSMEALGFQVVDIWTFREDEVDIVAVYIRNSDGSLMDMNQCVAATHALNDDTRFDSALNSMIEQAFCLEVSSCSPGMALRSSEDFSAFIGKVAQVQLDDVSDGRKASKGEIESVRGDEVELKTARGQWKFSLQNLCQAEVIA